MLTNTYNSSCDNVADFFCEKCNFKCSKKWLWERHILTSKHKNTYNYLQLSEKKCNNCECGKKYSHRQSLYNHKKSCKGFENEQPVNNDIIDSNLIVQLLKQNDEFKNIIIEQNNKILEVCKNNNNTTNIVNSHNKAFNLNVFLNETCKDAMDVNDFIDSFKLQL